MFKHPEDSLKVISLHVQLHISKYIQVSEDYFIIFIVGSLRVAWHYTFVALCFPINWLHVVLQPQFQRLEALPLANGGVL